MNGRRETPDSPPSCPICWDAGYLREDVPVGRLDIPVVGAVPKYNETWPYLLIEKTDPAESEWVRFTRFDSGSTSFIIDPADPTAARAVRNTLEGDHVANARVRLGYTFSRVFRDPAGRDFWEH